MQDDSYVGVIECKVTGVQRKQGMSQEGQRKGHISELEIHSRLFMKDWLDVNLMVDARKIQTRQFLTTKKFAQILDSDEYELTSPTFRVPQAPSNKLSPASRQRHGRDSSPQAKVLAKET